MAKPYTTYGEIRKISPFKNSTQIADADITQVIAEADDMIDSYMGQVYSLPLSSNPNTIVGLSKDLTSYLLYKRLNPNIEVMPGLTVDIWWKTLETRLENLRKHITKLYDSTGAELALRSGGYPSFYPTEASSEEDAEDSTAPKITINKEW